MAAMIGPPRRRTLLAAAAGAGALGLPAPLVAQEAPELRIGLQFGFTYLPLLVVRERGLLDTHARHQGIAPPRTAWPQMSGGGAMNDALLAGSLDLGTAGVPPVVLLWARTRGNLGVHAVASVASVPLFLNTNRPAIRGLRDFGSQDRIAVPTVRVSFQAVVLQMACEQEWGPGQHGRLDPLTVTMPHPDATAQLLSGRTEIGAHFGNPPFQNLQLRQPGIRRVLSSYEVVGGAHSVTLLYATRRFRDANPRTLRALLGALDEACAWIAANRAEAAALYAAAERSALPPAELEALLAEPEHRFGTTPEGVMRFAEFQHRTGMVRERPTDWRELFFPEVHDRAGA
jgi:NitT/TauT family transport system substrate-binding protein